jgi:hypothetical protein
MHVPFTTRVLDTTTLRVECTVSCARRSVSLGWSPDGSTLATGFRTTVDLWSFPCR